MAIKRRNNQPFNVEHFVELDEASMLNLISKNAYRYLGNQKNLETPDDISEHLSNIAYDSLKYNKSHSSLRFVTRVDDILYFQYSISKRNGLYYRQDEVEYWLWKRANKYVLSLYYWKELAAVFFLFERRPQNRAEVYLQSDENWIMCR